MAASQETKRQWQIARLAAAIEKVLPKDNYASKGILSFELERAIIELINQEKDLIKELKKRNIAGVNDG